MKIVGYDHPRDPALFNRHYTFEGFADNSWTYAPFTTEVLAVELLEAMRKFPYRIEAVPVRWAEGKPRELDAARRAAVWPDAPDEVLCLPKDELTQVLRDRLPGLLAEFRRDMEACGFKWEADRA